MKQPFLALLGVMVLGGASRVLGDDCCSCCHFSPSSYLGSTPYSAVLRRYRSEIHSSAYSSRFNRQASGANLADTHCRTIGAENINDSTSPSDKLGQSEFLRRSNEILRESSELLRRIRSAKTPGDERYAFEFPDDVEFDADGSYRSIETAPYLYRSLSTGETEGFRLFRELPSTSGGLNYYELRRVPSRGSYPSIIIP
jgi:hypothetical protein